MERSMQWPKMPGLSSRLSREFRLAFLTAMAVGTVVHLYMFTNMLPNHDALSYFIGSNEHLTSGRWALKFFSSFSTVYQIPLVIGLMSIFAIAFSAGLTVRMVRITHPVSIVLVSAFMVSFLPVAATFAYMYTADAYFFALLLSTAGAFAAKKYRFGWAAAIGCITVSLGIYQAYICYAIGLFLIDCILELLDGETPVREVVLRGLKYLGVLAAAYLCYFVILRLCLTAAGKTLGPYLGIDNMGRLPVSAYLQAAVKAYRSFLQFFWKPIYLTSRISYFQRLILAGMIVCALLQVLMKKIWRRPLALLLAAAGLLLLPLALNMTQVMMGSTEDSEIMIRASYAFVLVFVLAARLAEGVGQELVRSGKKIWPAPMAVNALLCAVILWSNICVTNTGYLSLNLSKEQATSIANRIAADAEELDDFRPDMKLMVVGSAGSQYNSPFAKSSSIMGCEEFIGGNCRAMLTSFYLPRLLNSMIGFNLQSVSSEEREEVEQAGLVDRMPCWPAEGSVQIYDEIVIVRLS